MAHPDGLSHPARGLGKTLRPESGNIGGRFLTMAIWQFFSCCPNSANFSQTLDFSLSSFVVELRLTAFTPLFTTARNQIPGFLRDQLCKSYDDKKVRNT
jgi:hypothetical protein